MLDNWYQPGIHLQWPTPSDRRASFASREPGIKIPLAILSYTGKVQVRDNIVVALPFLEFSLNGKVSSMTTPLTDDALELAVNFSPTIRRDRSTLPFSRGPGSM